MKAENQVTYEKTKCGTKLIETQKSMTMEQLTAAATSMDLGDDKAALKEKLPTCEYTLYEDLEDFGKNHLFQTNFEKFMEDMLIVTTRPKMWF